MSPGEQLRSPELLSPAGTLKNMRYAFAYGADAVYAGLPRYSLRVRNNDFDQENLAVGIAEARALGRRFYLACNLMPHGAKLRTFLADMEPVLAMGPDALIMADPGLIMLVRERWPDVPIHLSVQANTVNAAAVRFWQREGIARVILSRELSLDEIADIRDACPDTELEVFVHGALCIAYSGRCLLSGYFNHRDANQGTCTNACRWLYRVGAPDNSATRPWTLRNPNAGRARRNQRLALAGRVSWSINPIDEMQNQGACVLLADDTAADGLPGIFDRPALPGDQGVPFGQGFFLRDQPVGTRGRQPLGFLEYCRREGYTVGDDPCPVGIVGTTAALQVQQLAGDVGVVDTPGVLVLELFQTALSAPVTQAFPLLRGHCREGSALPIFAVGLAHCRMIGHSDAVWQPFGRLSAGRGTAYSGTRTLERRRSIME